MSRPARRVRRRNPTPLGDGLAAVATPSTDARTVGDSGTIGRTTAA
jgi:hypothetical protein